MKQYLKLKLSQKLSPQQIQLMKLIQLPTLDFEQKIQREIEENPALEQGQNSNDDSQSSFDRSKMLEFTVDKIIIPAFDDLEAKLNDLKSSGLGVIDTL